MPTLCSTLASRWRSSRLAGREPALGQLGLGGSFEVAALRPRPETEQFLQRCDAITGGRGWVAAECDFLERAYVVGEVRPHWRLLGARLAFDRSRDLGQPLLELARGPRTVVEEVAGVPLCVDEPALIEVAIDCFEDRDAASGLENGQPLGR